MAAPTAMPGEGPHSGPRINGRYRIVGDLGAGALGTVCLADDTVAGGRVAIRLLPSAAAGRARGVEVIDRIARSILPTSAAHPALVRVLDVGRADNGRWFIVTELVQGRRLSDVLAKGVPLEVATAIGLALELGGAVETVHNMGLVHGALRARNVMLLEDGRAKLMDLEVADLRDTAAMRPADTLPPADTLAPEQIRHEPITEKTDIYTFAILVYELLCGTPPFRAATADAVLARQSTERPMWTGESRRAVPRPVRKIIEQALAEQPERRPFMPQLLNGLVLKPSEASPTASARKIAILSGGVLAALLGGLVAWGIASRPSPVREPVYSVTPARPIQILTNRPRPVSAPINVQPSAPREAAPATASPPAARVSTPSTPSSPPHAITRQRREPQAPQTPDTTSAPPPVSRSDESYDPGAVIDWLLNESARRGK